jgi:hypothetical protein
MSGTTTGYAVDPVGEYIVGVMVAGAMRVRRGGEPFVFGRARAAGILLPRSSNDVRRSLPAHQEDEEKSAQADHALLPFA